MNRIAAAILVTVFLLCTASGRSRFRPSHVLVPSMNRRWAVTLGLGSLAACLMLAERTTATTIVPLTDDDLAASSLVIVEGRCQRLRAEWNEDRTWIHTLVTFKVTKVIKGDLQPGIIELRQFGGQLPDGATIIWGAPYWQKGWEMLLFLNPETDGTLRVAHLSLGYFRIIADQRTGEKLVVRSMPGPNVRVIGPQPFARCEKKDDFVARIQSLVVSGAAGQAPRSPRIEPRRAVGRSPNRPPSDFRFLSPGFRWFEPDTGDRIRFRVNRDRSPSPSGGMDEAIATAAAWSGVPGSSLRVEIAGETTACGLRADGTNAISFNDCTGRFDPPVNCSGVVAIGGVAQAVTNQSVSIGGRTFARIQDGDLIFNPDFGCILSDPLLLSEIMTHEMGHALGFGHSSDQADEPNEILRDASLFFIAHLDGRGASLRTDDMDGARFLYRATPSSAPLAILTDALPDAVTGSPFDFGLEATGTGPFTWSVIDGQLPGGLSLSSSGRILGTATSEMTTAFTVSVRDVANFEMSRSLALRSTGNPAPFVAAAKFMSASQKLIITAFNVDASASISVNGVPVVPPRAVKFKAAKNRLILTGSPADLNIRTDAPNTIVVGIRGQISNSFVF